MMESPLVELVGAQLKAMGHEVKSINGTPMGGFQAIMVAPETVFIAPARITAARAVGRVLAPDDRGRNMPVGFL